MDTSAGRPPNQQAPPNQQSLIRVDQVRKLPNLTEDQKRNYTNQVASLWQTLNSRPQNSPDYEKAHAKLSQFSRLLMNQVSQWKARQAQGAASAMQQNTAPPQAAARPTETLEQLPPIVQQRVRSFNFTFPPTVAPGTPQGDEWLKEAKMRFGQALNRADVARNKLAEYQRMMQQRNAAGKPFNEQEQQTFDQKVGTFNKMIAESTNFVHRFQEQQAEFKSQLAAKGSLPGQASGNQMELSGEQQPGDGSRPPTQQGPGGGSQGPSAHTISSAVNAARNHATQAREAAAMSPTTVQANATQPGSTISATPLQQHPSSGNIPQLTPSANQQGETPGSSTATQPPAGPPRPLSHSAAMAQAAAAANTTSNQPQSANPHAHPSGYINNVKKDDRFPIQKNLNVAPPQPVSMPASRPTLTNGPHHAVGMMNQPAIPKMTGYVLNDNEDGRVLSRKKLNELVRQVTGAGPEDGEQLTPEVEEVSLPFGMVAHHAFSLLAV